MNSKSVFKGYLVSNVVRVTVRDISKTPKVLDVAIRAGANAAGGVSFGLANDKAEREEALKKAVADATNQARIVARAAGIADLRLVQLQVGESYERGEASYYAGADFAVRAYAPIRAGRKNISASVTARFAAQGGAPVLTP